MTADQRYSPVALRRAYLGMCRVLSYLTDDPEARAALLAEASPAEKASGEPQAGLTAPVPRIDRARVVSWVDDPAAMLAWAEQIHPEAIEVVTVAGVEPRRVPERGPYREPDQGWTPVVTVERRVRPGFVEALLESARLDPGSSAPGVRVRRYPPRLVVRLSEPAAAIAHHNGTGGAM